MLETPLVLAFARAPLERGELTAGEAAQLDRLGSEQRTTEWLRGRAALRSVLARRGEPLDTSELRFPCARCSLSHSGSLAVAAGLDPDEAGSTGLGVDFERDKPMRVEAGRFFLTVEELAWVASLTAVRRSAHLLRLWTVKEALFKADLRNEGRTLRDYRLEDPGELAGSARTPDHAAQGFATKRVHGGYLTVAITRGERSC